MATVDINGHVVEPYSQCEGGSHFHLDASSSDYILVHTITRLQPETADQLRALEVQILKYVANNTYLCRYRQAELQEIRSLPFVEYANVYHQSLVIYPSLVSQLDSQSEDETTRQEEPQAYYVCLHHIDSLAEGVEQISRVTSLDRESIVHQGCGILKIHIPVTYLNRIAAIDHVARILPVTELEILTHNALCALYDVQDAHSESFASNIALLGGPIRGENEIIVISDSGLDLGQGKVTHPAFPTNKIKGWKSYLPTKETADGLGHGTSVAFAAVGAAADTADFGDVEAPARDATIINKVVFDDKRQMTALQEKSWSWDTFYSDFLIDAPVKDQNLPRITNLSLGPKPGGDAPKYPPEAEVLDTLVYNHPDWVYVLGAGNSGTMGEFVAHILGMSACKNGITVGASMNTHPVKNNRYDTTGPKGDINELASFSSLGPTQDARIKPDVVAPGCVVYTAKSRVPDLFLAKVDPPAGSPSGTPPTFNDQMAGPHKDTDYWFILGTSIAAPLISGCVAVIRQVYCKTFGCYPSAAMVKALLVHGAVDMWVASGMAPAPEFGPVQSNKQGYGRVNMCGSLLPILFEKVDKEGKKVGQGGVIDSQTDFPADPFKFVEVWNKLTDAEKEAKKAAAKARGILLRKSRSDDLEISKDGATITVTMAYTDPPGPTLINNLNLGLAYMDAKPPVKKWGRPDPTDPTKPISADKSNNVQKIIWRNAKKGKYRWAVICLSLGENPSADAVAHYALCWHVDP